MPGSRDLSELVQSTPIRRSTEVAPKALTENFLAEVIRVLIYSRHILAISYVIGYFILDEREAVNHKHMQVMIAYPVALSN